MLTEEERAELQRRLLEIQLDEEESRARDERDRAVALGRDRPARMR